MNTRRQFLKNIAVTSAALLSAQTLVRGEPRLYDKAEKPNILFIMCDQLTPKVLSCYDGPVDTPNIDRIAKEGVRFTNATCVTPYCSPSRVSMLTGLYPHQHGVVLNYGKNQPALTDHDITTDKIMDAFGYDVYFFGKTDTVYPVVNGENLSYYSGQTYRPVPEYFDSLNSFADVAKKSDSWSYQNYYGTYFPVEVAAEFRKVIEERDLITKWEDKPYSNLCTHMGRFKMPVDELFDVNVARLTKESIVSSAKNDKRFKITCSFIYPHDPFVLPSPYYEMFDPEKIELPSNVNFRERRYENSWSRLVVSETQGANGEEIGLREFLRIYYGAVKLVDDQVGEILKTLEDTDQLEKTVIIFTSDHGDMAGGHGMAWKSTDAFYEEMVTVPLIIRYPKQFKPQVLDIPADQVDFMPTELELAGLPVPDFVAGDSLVPYMTGEKKASEAYPYKFSERVENEDATRNVSSDTKAQYMVRGNGFKYIIYQRGDEYLYDLNKDPSELINLAKKDEYLDKKRELQVELKKWLKRTEWRGVSLPKA